MSTSSPLLDSELTDQFFNVNSPAEQTELRSMLIEFLMDVGPRFAELHGLVVQPVGDVAVPKRALHQLRGVVANFGLVAAAGRMQRLEHAWATATAQERARELRASELELTEGIKELRARYPYLA